MITTLLRAHTLGVLPNCRFKNPIVPGPQTSCVIRRSAFTQIFLPAFSPDFSSPRATNFFVHAIKTHPQLSPPSPPEWPEALLENKPRHFQRRFPRLPRRLRRPHKARLLP